MSIASSLFVSIFLLFNLYSNALVQHSVRTGARSWMLEATVESKSVSSSADGGDEKHNFQPKVWPGNRPPTPNVKLLGDKMDATWGRGKFRAEVWAGEDNPVNDWTSKYAPSEEELEAMLLGFDFTNPKQQLEEMGVNYEEAVAETKRVAAERAKLAEAEYEEMRKKITDNKAFREEFLKMQDVLYEVAFRALDDDLQRKKGQPSLDEEDTGEQYKNDPV